MGSNSRYVRCNVHARIVPFFWDDVLPTFSSGRTHTRNFLGISIAWRLPLAKRRGESVFGRRFGGLEPNFRPHQSQRRESISCARGERRRGVGLGQVRHPSGIPLHTFCRTRQLQSGRWPSLHADAVPHWSRIPNRRNESAFQPVTNRIQGRFPRFRG